MTTIRYSGVMSQTSLNYATAARVPKELGTLLAMWSCSFWHPVTSCSFA